MLLSGRKVVLSFVLLASFFFVTIVCLVPAFSVCLTVNAIQILKKKYEKKSG